MNERTQDRLFAACGIASAVLVHVGLFVGLASGQAFVNLGSSPAKVAHELAKPAGTGVWVGAYLGLHLAAPLLHDPWPASPRARARPPHGSSTVARSAAPARPRAPPATAAPAATAAPRPRPFARA
jgi:hypothetical protein